MRILIVVGVIVAGIGLAQAQVNAPAPSELDKAWAVCAGRVQFGGHVGAGCGAGYPFQSGFESCVKIREEWCKGSSGRAAAAREAKDKAEREHIESVVKSLGK